jgi:hypothetical protein
MARHGVSKKWGSTVAPRLLMLGANQTGPLLLVGGREFVDEGGGKPTHNHGEFSGHRLLSFALR